MARSYGRGSWVAALVVHLLLVGGAQVASAQQREALTFKDDWVHGPKWSAIFLGLEKGFFAAEGIDLSFESGRGSNANFQLMGAKKLLFASGDAATAARFITEGLAVKVVFGYLQRTPISVIYRKGLGIRSPKDLEGKKIGQTPASAGGDTFLALAERNGVNLSRIQFVNVTGAARNQSLLNRDVHAIIGFFADNVPFLRSKGGKVGFFRFADYGANTLGTSITVHGSVIDEKPDTLRRFLRAVSRSLRYAVENRDETIQAMHKRAEVAMKDPKVARQVLDNYLNLMHTENTEGKPLGWMARKDWEQTIEILTKYSGLKNASPAEAYYTNAFVPGTSM